MTLDPRQGTNSNPPPQGQRVAHPEQPVARPIQPVPHPLLTDAPANHQANHQASPAQQVGQPVGQPIQAPTQPARAQPAQVQPAQVQPIAHQHVQQQHVQHQHIQQQPVGQAVAAQAPVGQAAVGQAVVGQAVVGQAIVNSAQATASRQSAQTRSTAEERLRNPEEDEEEITEKAVKAAPPWLVSLVVHMLILIVLALLTIPALARKKVELVVDYADEEGEQLIDDAFDMPALENLEVETPLLAEDLVEVEDPFAAAPTLDITLDAANATSEIVAPSIGMALTGREKGMKQALLAAYGGTKATEAAVADGLAWLAKNQEKSGSWSLAGPYTDGGHIENRVAATAMAMLAFQGAGYTHKKGKYKALMKKAVDSLLKMQDADGNFYQKGPTHHRLYSQAQASIAICELYGMTKDSALRDPAQTALNYAARVQSPLGGWRYSPREDSDTSVTGWFVMAFQSGRMAGLEVNTTTLEKITEFLNSVQHDGGATYAYKPDEDPTITMTAEGLLCRQYLGWDYQDPRLRQGVDELALNPIDASDENVYYWYYATQVMHHMGGDDWFKWNNVMRDVLPESQVRRGPEKGSWSPNNDSWGARGGGRLFQTCLSLYNLEVYYRHLPIYKH